jgi:hypothetical protein
MEFKKGHAPWNKDRKTCQIPWFKDKNYNPTKHPNWKGFRITQKRVAGPNNTFKKILMLEIGKCERCGISDKRVLDLHHKDGNKLNNLKDNIQLLCSNCHRIVHCEEKE